MRKKEKGLQVMRTRNKILMIVAIFIATFIIVMIFIFCKYQSTPDTLIGCVLGGGGLVELITGSITIAEKLKGDNEDGN